MSTKSKMTNKTLKQIEEITGEKLSLGRLILAIRQADDISQVDFAKSLGISRQHLCDIEHNRKAISPQLAAEYADKLGYSAQYFVQLAMQESLDRAGLAFTIIISPQKRSSGGRRREASV